MMRMKMLGSEVVDLEGIRAEAVLVWGVSVAGRRRDTIVLHKGQEWVWVRRLALLLAEDWDLEETGQWEAEVDQVAWDLRL